MTGTIEREDQEAERLIRRSFRLQWLGLGLTIAGGVVAYALPENQMWIGCLVLFIAVAVSIGSVSTVTEADAAAYPRRHRDVQQGRWRVALIAQLLLAAMGARGIAHLPMPLAPDTMSLWFGIAMLLLPPSLLVFGPKGEYDEEITRALRARVLQLGYVILVLVMALAIAAMALLPAYLVTVLAWGLFAGIAIPILVYVVLDMWNDRGETP